MDILTAGINDIEELAAVEIESKQQSLAEVIEPFEIDHDSRLYRWRTYFRAESPQTSKPERVVFKAVLEGKLIGYIAGHLTTRYNKDAEIQSFYVLKQHQRKGIGKLLLSKFTEWLETRQAKSLCVGIAENNLYKAFYLKHGGQFLNEHWIVWDDIKHIDKALL